MQVLPDCRTLILLDCEYTSWEGSQARRWSEPWEEKEIVQIAMLALDRETLQPHNHFSCLVKPSLNPQLSDYFMKLTGLIQENVDQHGINLVEALHLSEKFIESFQGPVQVVSNGVDGYLINANAALVELEELSYFEQAISIHPYLRACIPTYRNGHYTSDLAGLVGQPLEGHHHNALYDVHSLAVALRAINERVPSHM
ncbi:3'-5' exonuclease [Terasakiella sp. SH-1]|uniref:3'-5' exonuclease n=1 Tax=Terasakiella sp. SH-1 TaxID=2560057 RepID=UPI00107316E9|nr:3'-5' exonuclease [Terasakiella sp. SH-1]